MVRSKIAIEGSRNRPKAFGTCQMDEKGTDRIEAQPTSRLDQNGARADFTPDAIADRGDLAYDRVLPQLPAELKGHYIAIEDRSGDYVTGVNWHEARHAYVTRFGASSPGYVRRIGGEPGDF